MCVIVCTTAKKVEGGGTHAVEHWNVRRSVKRCCQSNLFQSRNGMLESSLKRSSPSPFCLDGR
jgi:hypothetical protein